jgi:hypothetical protein
MYARLKYTSSKHRKERKEKVDKETVDKEKVGCDGNCEKTPKPASKKRSKKLVK